jgi:hypothetical protein
LTTLAILFSFLEERHRCSYSRST